MFFDYNTTIVFKIAVLTFIILSWIIVIMINIKNKKLRKTGKIITYIAVGIIWSVFLIYHIVYFDILYLIDKNSNAIESTTIRITEVSKKNLSFNYFGKRYSFKLNSDFEQYIGHVCEIEYYKLSGYINDIQIIDD